MAQGAAPAYNLTFLIVRSLALTMLSHKTSSWVLNAIVEPCLSFPALVSVSCGQTRCTICTSPRVNRPPAVDLAATAHYCPGRRCDSRAPSELRGWRRIPQHTDNTHLAGQTDRLLSNNPPAVDLAATPMHCPAVGIIIGPPDVSAGVGEFHRCRRISPPPPVLSTVGSPVVRRACFDRAFHRRFTG